MKINTAINYDDCSLDTLKYFLLYFDEINIYIPRNIYNYKTNTFVNITNKTNIFQQLNYLHNENLISFYCPTSDTFDNDFKNISTNFLQYILEKCPEEFANFLGIPKKDEKKRIDRFIECHDILLNALESGSYSISNNEPLSFFLNTLTESSKKNNIEYFPLDLFFELSTLLIVALFDLYQGNTFVTNCNFLNEAISIFYHNANKQDTHTFIDNYIANECLKILLPNFSKLSIEDVLDLKVKANDELSELKSYIKEFSTNSSNYNIGSIDFDVFTQSIQLKLNHSVDSFKRKCKNMKYELAQKIITDLKNPVSYSPLLVSLFHNIPAHIEFFASLTLISSNTMFEYLKTKNELKNDPLYFTYKISKYF